MNLKYFSSRWLWLTAGIIAILGLTGLNIYSLNRLRTRSIETIQKSKKLQVAEFAHRARHRFIHPFHGLSTVDMSKLNKTFQQTGNLTQELIRIIDDASKDSIFKDIYYLPASSYACYRHKPILIFQENAKQFVTTKNYGDIVCDGVGMARVRMRALIDGYQYNNKVLFDTHRSLTLALVNLNTQTVVGYLVLPINQKFLINDYLQPELVKYFGGKKDAGITVWLRYWTQQKVLASSDPHKRYKPDHVQYVHRFPDFFDNWGLYVTMNEAILASADNNSFYINIVVLMIALIFLIGALVFMFMTAQREKSLAERQSSFLANVTHELKTPLAVMQAAGENLSDGRIQNTERIEKYGSHIYSEALRLRKMIEKLLDVAKADAGQSFVKPTPCSIADLINNYIQDHRAYIENSGFILKTEIEENVPQSSIDKHSFYTIIDNLVRNTIKYSPNEKFLKITLQYRSKNIILKIEDHGSGIDSKSIKHIFEKFYRVENSMTAQTNGYGLGLSIVKNLVELNNGTIKVESEENRGSIFTIIFPTIEIE